MLTNLSLANVKLMKTLANKYILALIALALPVVVSAETIPGIIGKLQTWLGLLVTLVVGVAVVVFIWGLVVFIAKSGDETAKEEGRRKMVWGIIAIFVMVSVWGIVRLISTSFLGTDNNNTALPPPGLPGASSGGGGNTIGS